ncbi:hypothetical protein [Methylobacterium fujisawaense]|uniref:hypothetical protein n=1 Tax=Methylobacterium fujisawaense TaxID=107400 RepID=UPI00313D6C54
MKKPIFGGVTFAPVDRTLDFSGVPGFDIRALLAVVDLTQGAILYAAGKPGLGYTALAGSVVSLAVDTAEMAASDKLLILYDDGTDVLPAGAATDATLQLILNAIKAQRVETIWTDDTGARFIRLDASGVISWTDVAGNPSSAPGSGARPDADSGTVVSRYTYKATASGTGFASGDFLDHVVVTDGDAGDLVSNFWVNVTAGTKIAAPSAASITPLSPLPEGAATALNQAQVIAGLGAPADAAATADSGTFSLIGLVKRGLGNWTTLLARIPALVSGRMPVDGSGVTQPISAAALPLPAGAATAAKQPALGTAGTPSADVLTVQGSATGTLLPVSAQLNGGTATVFIAAGSNLMGKVGIDQTTPGTTNGVVVNSSALPAGAATAAKQPALGTAGTPSADVLTVQGASTGQPLPVLAQLNGGTATVFLAAGAQAVGSLVASSTGASGATFGTYYTATTAAAGQIIKGATGNVFNLTAWNSDTVPVWVKLFNKASAPTMGTDSAVWEAMVPAGGTISVPFADVGLSLGTGIAVGFSGAQGPTNATALNAAGKAGVSLALK